MTVLLTTEIENYPDPNPELRTPVRYTHKPYTTSRHYNPAPNIPAFHVIDTEHKPNDPWLLYVVWVVEESHVLVNCS